jgi:hypothetical protein
MEDYKDCNCEEWAKRISGWAWANGKSATTYTCPRHGSVTIDNRDIPEQHVTIQQEGDEEEVG